MRKTIFIFLVALSAFLIVIRLSSRELAAFWEKNSRAGLRVDSNPAGEVFVDQVSLGQTPAQKEDLKKGDHLVEIKGESVNWQGYVKLSTGTLTVVNRELSPDPTDSSGEVISLEKGKGVSIISNPAGAQVLIDGVDKGVAPVLISDLSLGEHQFLLSKPNFTPRSIRSVLTEGFRLNMAVDLAVSELDMTQIPSVPIKSTTKVRVLNTPTGFLRVRSGANTSSEEIARVSPGDTLTLLEEVPGWKRIKLSSGKEGFVSAQYVEKLTP